MMGFNCLIIDSCLDDLLESMIPRTLSMNFFSPVLYG